MDRRGIHSGLNTSTFFSPKKTGIPKNNVQHKKKTGRAALKDASGSGLRRLLVQEHHLLGGLGARLMGVQPRAGFFNAQSAAGEHIPNPAFSLNHQHQVFLKTSPKSGLL